MTDTYDYDSDAPACVFFLKYLYPIYARCIVYPIPIIEMWCGRCLVYEISFFAVPAMAIIAIAIAITCAVHDTRIRLRYSRSNLYLPQVTVEDQS